VSGIIVGWDDTRSKISHVGLAHRKKAGDPRGEEELSHKHYSLIAHVVMWFGVASCI